MKSRISSPMALMVAAVLASGCGGSDGPTNPGESNLTKEEALEVFGEIMSAMVASISGGPAADEAPVAMDTFSFEGDFACEGGGSIGLTGTFETDLDETSSGHLTYSFVETPSDCGVTTESGASYRVNGNPNIQISASAHLTNGEPVGPMDMSFTGGLSWTATNGSASGSCTMNLQYSFDLTTGTGQVKGTICGHNVDEQYSA